MPIDYKKTQKEFYRPSKTPHLIQVPPLSFLAVQGQGDPNQPGGAYQEAIGQLYAVAFTLKMSKLGPWQPAGYFDYVMPPLEGLWWMPDGAPIDFTRKDAFHWISLLRLPEYVVPAALLVFGYPTQQQQEREKPRRRALEHIVHENAYRRMEPAELEAMLADNAGARPYGAWLDAFCKRKYNSDFSREMSRSMAEYLKPFLP